jgi:hypothetical protein
MKDVELYAKVRHAVRIAPVGSSTGARYRMSLISAVSSRGHMRFMIKEKGGVNGAVASWWDPRTRFFSSLTAVLPILPRRPRHLSPVSAASCGCFIFHPIRRTETVMNWCGSI